MGKASLGEGGFTSHHKSNEGLTNVWLTPKWLIDAIGPFDLDPCAADPRPFDIGKTNYTEVDDGLTRAWKGFVFCNPPYGPHVGTWMEKLAAHGNGIALVFARTETAAMQKAMAEADAAFFIGGRLTFLPGQPPFEAAKHNAGAPSVLLAFGNKAVKRLQNLSKIKQGILYFGPGKPNG